MFTTPRKTGDLAAPKTPNAITPLRKGLFSDGIWRCNCSPRLPASYFRVKKDGPNKGRGFYTCAQPKQDACGFFLWEDHATMMGGQAVTSPSKSNFNSAARHAPEPANTISLSQSTANTETDSEDDEFGEWPLTKQDEKEVVEVAAQHISPVAYPETPRKAIRTSYMATPSTKRKRDEDDSLPTPMTNNLGGIPVTPSTSRRRLGALDGIERSSLSSFSTPSGLGRFRDAEENYEITDEVLDLLRPDRISERTTSAIREALNMFALQASGVSKARDLVRASLKAKDTQIATLQQRISTLEAEREVDKAFIRKCKGDIRHYATRGETKKSRDGA
ncbi:hypothetical protein PVAG01_01147 [Phlyctema vagabunda]|uniref:GRF-type domain-containing protein n=1 Tax=Phlyctema vagabunda TaxID=108571 RepID=A0ABR4PWB6_9HELO